MDKREVFLYSNNYIHGCKNFIFYNLGSETEIRDHSLSFLLAPLEETLKKLKIYNFYLLPSKNLLSKINELKDFFKRYHFDYYDQKL